MDGKIKGIRFCEVISVEDNFDSDVIKVFLAPEDNSKTFDDIPYAFPLLPKMFHVKPKKGEAVLVLLAESNNGDSQRYYIGPVISQDHKIYKDPYFMGADSFLRGRPKDFDEQRSRTDEYVGLYPGNNDIVIRGRKNADIQITEDDVRIKAGVKVVNEDKHYNMAFNTKNPAYAKLKYHPNSLKGNTQSTATVVADKIALLSHNSEYKLTDRNELITDEELNKVIESAYKLPYGEKLIEFLNTFVDAFLKHTHPYPMMPTNPFYTTQLLSQKAQMLDKKQMLSDTVRIN